MNNPKYAIKDIVKFSFCTGEKQGVIASVDGDGGFFGNGQVTYDIWSKEEDTLYKAIYETKIKEKIGVSQEEITL